MRKKKEDLNENMELVAELRVAIENLHEKYSDISFEISANKKNAHGISFCLDSQELWLETTKNVKLKFPDADDPDLAF